MNLCPHPFHFFYEQVGMGTDCSLSVPHVWPEPLNVMRRETEKGSEPQEAKAQ